MTPRGLFIGGAGTDVGKTHVAAMIARSLVNAGRRVGVYKPAASGCRLQAGKRIAEDAVQLWEAADRPGDFDLVAPQGFLAPLAPHLAARAEGRRIDRGLLRRGLEPWLSISDVVIVEGAGGLMSPLSDEDYNIDLASEFGFPLVIVAANELGVINAAMQSVITARTQAPGLPIAGLILNQARRCEDDASLASNAEELTQRCPLPLLASIGFGETVFRSSIDWFALARRSNGD